MVSAAKSAPTVPAVGKKGFTIGYCDKLSKTKDVFWFLKNVSYVHFKNNQSPDIAILPKGTCAHPVPNVPRIRTLTEVFWSTRRPPCEKTSDAVMYRSQENVPMGCATNIHYILGNVWRNMAGFPNPTLKQPKSTRKTRFCVMIVKAVMLRKIYPHTDALVRWAMFNLLNEYKRCDYIGPQEGVKSIHCPSNPKNASNCMRPYKFTITMENTAEKGYITEKIVNGLAAGSVPIYFGAPDVTKYFNEDRFINCDVNTTVLNEFRSYYRRPGKFSFSNYTSPSDTEVVAWATEFLRPHLAPCVKKVIALDNNSYEYDKAIQSPIWTKSSYMDGTYERDQLLRWYQR